MTAPFNPGADTLQALPEVFLCTMAIVVLILSFVVPDRRGWMEGLSVAAVVGTGALLLRQLGEPASAFSGMYLVDNFALFFKAVFLISTLFVILMSINYLHLERVPVGEFYAVLLFSTLGMMFIASGGNLLSLYVGLETMSISIYVLAGFLKRDRKSNEAALKYLLMGAFTSGVILYGIALLYGLTGTLDIKQTAATLVQMELTNPALLLAMVMLTAGLGFKIAAVPFHMYVPDVYEGAMTTVTAFLAVGSEAAGVAALLRVFLGAIPQIQDDWAILFWILSVLTMTVGNVLAMAQRNMKRMLAYSSIAHIGYVLIGFVVGTEQGISAMLLYVLIYEFMTAGAFAMVIYLRTETVKGDLIEDFAGLARVRPVAAAAMVIFLMSLTGIPPTAGFVGKLYLFGAAINSGYIWLAVVAAVNTAISLFYYMRVAMVMYMLESPGPVSVSSSRSLYAAVIFAVLGTLVIGIYPGPFLELAQGSLSGLMK
ncbi:MAG: NADH-quinone oxidoreductase subunit N [candidate division NC10 bacterium]|nr:NADH-quinone oxidoreductase subunit N [candidate division NC10 bacterium]